MSVDEILVSVIVPVYNVGDYLYKCIKSIQDQTHYNLEIILVDDGSTDDSGMICDKFAQEDRRIRVIHKENGGITSARKAGVNLATGSYIGFVDGDDWIDANMYEEMLAAAIESNAQVVLTDMYRHKFTGEITVWKCEMPAGTYCMNSTEGEKVVKNLFPEVSSSNIRGISGGLHVKLFEKVLLKRHIKNIDDRIRGFADDKVVAYSVILHAKTIQIMNKAFYHGVDRKSSATHSVNYKFFEQMQMVYDYFKEMFRLHPMQKCLMEQLNQFVMNSVLTQVNDLADGMMVPKYYLSDIECIYKKNIVLYGAGKVGKSYYKHIKADGVANIVMWIDKVPDAQRNVFALEDIRNVEYDFIVVSVLEKMLYESIHDDLVKLHIDADKILWIPPVYITEHYAVSDY